MNSTLMTIAVTGLHRGDNPQPGGAVIRSLRRKFQHIRIIGLSYDPLESGLYSAEMDQLDAAYSLPFPGNGIQPLKERLETIFQSEKVDIIIPCLDSEIENFISLTSYLRERGVQTMLPSHQSIKLRSKPDLAKFCNDNHFPCPQTKTCPDIYSLLEAAEELTYPLFIKGKFYEGHLVNNVVELRHVADELLKMWGGPLLAQEAIVGEEYCYTGIGDGRGNIQGYCSIRKMLVTKTGKGFAGIVINDPDLNRLVERIVKELAWNGPFEMEFIKPANGQHKLIEINPRFPAWIDFPSQLGCNMPAQLIEKRLNNSTAKLPLCEPGKMFIRHSIDVVGDIAELAEMATKGVWCARNSYSETELTYSETEVTK